MSALAVAVVGGGIMGLCTAWALARQGHAVQVFEQGPIPNPLGGSVDQHRLIRHSYGAERGYTRMVTRAYAAWEELWRDLGERPYAPSGTLALDTGGGSWFSGTMAALAAEGVPFRRIAARALARAFPLLDPAQVREAIHLDSGGTLFAERIVAALAARLPAMGVKLRPNTRVRALDPERARITTEGGETLGADVLVVAAGPWVGRLLPETAARITPSRQVVVYLAPPDDLAAAWLQHPMVLDIDPAAGFYLVPPRAGMGLKVGDHGFTLSGDPDRDRDATAEEAARIAGLCERRLAGFARYRIDFAKTCFYDVAAEERFVVERFGASAWLLGGFSGHGFKFGAVIGQEIARAVAGQVGAAALASWAAGGAEATPA